MTCVMGIGDGAHPLGGVTPGSLKRMVTPIEAPARFGATGEADRCETLPQRLYLLGHTPGTRRFEAAGLRFPGPLLRAAALAELTVRGLLDDRSGKAVRKAAEPPHDSFLAEVWHDVPARRGHRWLTLLHHRAHEADAAVREQLAALGTITLAGEGRTGAAASPQVTVVHPDHVLGLREKARNPVLLGPEPATVSPADVATTVLAADGEVHSVFTRNERRTHLQALRALGAQFDDAVPGLRTALRTSVASSRSSGGGRGR